MKAMESSLSKLLQTKSQFTIPIYQRTYSWTLKQCLQLWNDIIATGSDPERHVHFIGSIVYIGDYGPMVKVAKPLVIDGQQRLTTVSLLLIALRDYLRKHGGLDEVDPDEINYDHLVNVTVKGEDHYKLRLTQNDRQTLYALIDGEHVPANHSQRIVDNFEFFREKVSKEGDLRSLYYGIQKLMVVEVVLDPKEDNPQLIFESMNSTGLALTQADLIRNYVLMGMKQDEQEHLYTHVWHKMEDEFGQANYVKHFDMYMRHFLTVRMGEIPRIDAVYAKFKEYAASGPMTIPDIVRDVAKNATFYTRIALGKEPDATLKRAFDDLAHLETGVAIPFLLELYEDYHEGIIDKADTLRIVRYVESYIIRRAVCDLPTNALNKIFLTFSKTLDKQSYVESVEARFRLLAGTGRYPNDEEFRRSFVTRDIYNLSKRRNYLLEKLANHGSMEPVVIDALTIEHIMPQNEHLSPAWQQDLGPEWKRIQETYLHTIGNLTLTGYNSSLSDRPFLEKRNMVGGFKKSQVSLNGDLGELEHWSEAEIVARGARLADRAATIWGHPAISDERLDVYRAKAQKQGDTLSPDIHFQNSPVSRSLWEALRVRILNLDSSVTEEVFKSYIAYKSSTNFVDINPRKNWLIATLNIEFDALDDPREWCRDVTTTGKLGNGDAQFSLSPDGDMEYAMSLIQQAFDFRESDLGVLVTS